MRRSGSRNCGGEGELGWGVRSGASRKERREGASKVSMLLSPWVFFFLPRFVLHHSFHLLS